ncbi:TPA: hypothetical protein UMV35_004055 [Stenotrophomonas maltophilia]|nr:hypothetical protein [Stenotrophomonas maltophilia]
MTLQNKVDRFISDSDIAHEIIHGKRSAVVETEGGPVPTLANAIGSVSNLGERLVALEDGQSAGRIVKATWSELAAVPTTSAGGRGASVLADSGTHVDPVSGAQVPNTGEYTEHASGWQWARADGLASKADKAAVAAVAGVKSAAPAAGNYLEVDLDAMGNVARAVHADGTYEYLRTKVGTLTMGRDANGVALVDGHARWHGVYEEWSQPLAGRFADALEVHIDAQFHIGYVRFSDGTEWRVGTVDPSPSVGSATLQEAISLPDASYPNRNGGFTCTGLDLITTGKFRGCWVVGNDGRQREGSNDFYCSVLILSPDMRRVVREFMCNTPIFAGIKSIQGVAWDPTDDTIWFVDKTNKTLRHIDTAGTKLADEIVVSHTANGLAYDAATDVLWSPDEGTTTVYILSCATGLVVRTLDGVATDADHVHLVPSRGEVWITRGSNGADGQLVIYDQAMTRKHAITLPGSQAIEGGHYDPATGIFTNVNDGAFHESANPPLALANKHHIKGI